MNLELDLLEHRAIVLDISNYILLKDKTSLQKLKKECFEPKNINMFSDKLFYKL